MRKALNENPVVQVVALGALGIFVAFMFMTRVMGGDSVSDEGATSPVTPSASTAAAPPPAAEAPAVPADPAAEAPIGFEAGAGLPASVADAYEAGDVVAILVIEQKGTEDKRLESQAQALRGRSATSVFVVEAKDVARYSRIASGVNLDRTPALVVIEPKGKGDATLPTATVSYGFRGAESLQQAVSNARYTGKQLPYHPG